MKFAVIAFPGSSEHDMYYAIANVLGESVDYVRYDETNLANYDGIILPGGFSYGNYLRSGALAKLTPIINAVKQAASDGKLILGVSNGFQILLEAQLLPGAVIENTSLRFNCIQTQLVVENNQTSFTADYQLNEQITMPFASGFGNYYCDQETLDSLRSNNQIVFRYLNNPNGSLDNIAGIINRQGNVLGIMPNPERAVETLLGSEDGKKLFTSMVSTWRDSHVKS